jgi:hypothetical protein
MPFTWMAKLIAPFPNFYALHVDGEIDRPFPEFLRRRAVAIGENIP